MPRVSQAAIVTWDGGGTTNNWSEAANWDTNIVPAAADTVTFNATSVKNSTVDSLFAGTIATLNINAGYTGTLTLARSLTVSGDITVSAGTFDLGGQNLTVQGGDINVGTGATLTTTTAAGTTTLSGTGNLGGGGSTTFHNLTITQSAASIQTTTQAGAITVNNNLQVTNTGGSTAAVTTFNGSTFNLTVSGTLTVTTTAAGATTFNAGTAGTLSVTGTATITNAASVTGSVTTFDAQGKTLSLSGDLTVSATAAGSTTFNQGSVALPILGNLLVTNGASATGSTTTWTGSTANLTVSGTLTVSATAAGDTTFNAGTAGTLSVGIGTVTVTNSASATGSLTKFDAQGKTLNFPGDLTVSATVAGSTTFTQGSLAFTVPGNLLVTNGASATASTTTWAGSTANLTVSGTLTVSATISGSTTFNAGTAGTLSVGIGTVTVTNSASATASLTKFDAQGKTLNFPGDLTVSATAPGSTTFNQGSVVLIVPGNLLVTNGGSAAISTTTWAGSTANLTVSGTLTVSATSSGSTTFNAGTAGTLSVTGAVSITNSGGSNSSLTTFNGQGKTVTLSSTLTVDASNSGDTDFKFTSLGSLSVTGNATLKNTSALLASFTTISPGSTTWSFGGNLTFQDDAGAGTLTYALGTETLIFNGSANQTVNTLGKTVKNVTVNSTGGAVILGSNLAMDGTLTVTAGTLSLAGFNISDAPAGAVATLGNIAGTIRLQGIETVFWTTNDIDSGTYEYVGRNVAETLTLKEFGATDYFNLTINDTNVTKATFASGAAKSIAGAFTVSSGTYNANGQTTTVSGLATVGGGTYQASTATQTFSGGLAVSSGTFTGSSGALDVNGALTLSGGTLTAPSTTITVSGNFAHTAGTFTHNFGTVNLDGANQTISGATTFNHLTKTVTAAATLTFPAGVGSEQTIVGALTLQGASGQLLSLHSSSDGTQWRINPQGSRSVSFVDVKDSNNINATAIDATSSTNSLNNTNWTFGPGAFTKLQLLVPGETASPGSATGKTGSPTAQIAGTAFSVTVNAVDANWNLVSSVTDTVGLTSSDPNATLPANAALVAGTKTFSVTLKTAGSQTLTASDITDGTKTANTSPGITVMAAPVVIDPRRSVR